MVCFDTPSSRATSSVARPASTCFSAAIICASLCLLMLIRFPFPSSEIVLHLGRIQGGTSFCHPVGAARRNLCLMQNGTERSRARRPARRQRTLDGEYRSATPPPLTGGDEAGWQQPASCWWALSRFPRTLLGFDMPGCCAVVLRCIPSAIARSSPLRPPAL